MGEWGKERKERLVLIGEQRGAPNPHGTRLPTKAGLQTVPHSPSHTNVIKWGGKRASPRRQNRLLPSLKYLREQRAVAARWLS